MIKKPLKLKGTHWLSLVGSFDPSEYEGFIYFVTNWDGSKQYIGKKNFQSITRKRIVGRKNRKIFKKPSNWLKYTSSSDYLKADIEKFGIESFRFFIVDLYKTKSGLSHAECYYQHMCEVMTRKGNNLERVFYNRMIAGVKFIPTEHVTPESKRIVKSLLSYEGHPFVEQPKEYYFCGDFGKFESTEDAAQKVDVSEVTIKKRIKNCDDIIKSNSAMKGAKGKTWRELGWYFGTEKGEINKND